LVSIFANTAFDISTGDSTQFNPIFSSLFIFLEHFPFHFTFFIAGLLVAYLLSTL
jgi:glycine betaine transporter